MIASGTNTKSGGRNRRCRKSETFPCTSATASIQRSSSAAPWETPGGSPALGTSAWPRRADDWVGNDTISWKRRSDHGDVLLRSITVDCGNCGCGCICVKGGDCYSFCEDCGSSGGPGIYIGLSAFVSTERELRTLEGSDSVDERPRRPGSLTGSGEVQMKVQGMSMGSLALALDRIAPGQLLVPVGRLGEEVTFTKSGSLEEILQDLAIKMAE